MQVDRNLSQVSGRRTAARYGGTRGPRMWETAPYGHQVWTWVWGPCAPRGYSAS